MYREDEPPITAGRGIWGFPMKHGIPRLPVKKDLVGYRLRDVVGRGAWEGDTRLHLIPHVNCRVADLPVRRIRRGRHQIVDFSLPYGDVLHNYLA